MCKCVCVTDAHLKAGRLSFVLQSPINKGPFNCSGLGGHTITTGAEPSETHTHTYTHTQFLLMSSTISSPFFLPFICILLLPSPPPPPHPPACSVKAFRLNSPCRLPLPPITFCPVVCFFQSCRQTCPPQTSPIRFLYAKPSPSLSSFLFFILPS